VKWKTEAKEVAMPELKEINSVNGLTAFLRSLGYTAKADLLYIPDFGFPDNVKKILEEFYLLSDCQKRFQIYFAKIPDLSRSNYRNIIESFNRRFPQVNTLFVFTKDWSEIAFVNPERIALEVGKAKFKLKTLLVDREHVYHTDREVIESIRITPLEQHPDIIYEKQKKAFDVERVTKSFFEAYKFALGNIKEELSSQKKKSTSQEVHSFAQQFLSRIMFLYFVQKKGWLKWKDYVQDKRYIRNLWGKYKGHKNKGSNFYSQWLAKLFFNAFQGPGRHADIHKDPHLPDEIKESFVIMPFLNGGLFIRNKLDDIGFELPDEVFQLLFDFDPNDSKRGFLERFNFTIREDTPLEVEVAVDPEMLGKVYESLISEEERGKGGIFYTPRTEIDLMCRLSLLEYLTEETGLPKSELIPLIFDPQTILSSSVIPVQTGIQKGLSDDDLRKVMAALHKARIVDPAVGSASFLVGMMNVLVELYRNLSQRIEKKEVNLFGLKNQIISENLYGVDVKDWAVMVGELRLWLSLIIETEEKYIDIYGKPLLPSFTFKMRKGDSLVEEIGGRQLSLRGEFRHIPTSLRNKIEEIKGKKAKYFSGARHEWEKEIEGLEHDLLKNILLEEMKKTGEKIGTRKRMIESAPKEQIELIKTKDKEEVSYGGKEKELEAEIERLDEEKERLQGALMNIGKEKDYFFWEIDFAEVFAEKGGFDIVFGNPPYVRQERIAFPLEREEDYEADEWRERKRQYKEKLVNSARMLWGSELKVDKKSDLYVYFYYHSLALLKPKGTFCFINSNSWLDVGYGAGLQEFLLKRMEPLYVIDNIARRSFEADVNTVIVLIKRPTSQDVINPPTSPFSKGGQRGILDKGGQGGILKFIAFKKPFDEVIKPETILEIEAAKEHTVTDNFRISPKDRKELLIEGIEIPEEEEQAELVKKDPLHLPYSGNKWGGKYLRAPDIYWTIIEKGRGKLVRLGDIAEVRFGIKTGANEFFYLDDDKIEEWGIEKEFLNPVIKSPRECKSILIRPEDLKYKIFMCHKDKKDLKATNALKYIKWGETKKFHERPSCRGRPRWWDLGVRPAAKLNCNYLVNEVMRFYYSFKEIFVSDNFQEIHSTKDEEKLCLSVNSPITGLQINLAGRSNFGGGLLKIQTYEVANILCVDPTNILADLNLSKLIKSPSLGLNDIFQPDRRQLDNIIFDALGLTQGERDAVYEAVIELVRQRLEKAKSR